MESSRLLAFSLVALMGSIMCFVLYLELRKKPEPPDDNGPRWYEQFDWTPDPPGGESLSVPKEKELIGSGSL